MIIIELKESEEIKMTKNEIRREYGRSEIVRLDSQLIENGYRYHHTSLASGYYAIDAVTINRYKGKFGEGYVVESHADNSRFHFISYYVK